MKIPYVISESLIDYPGKISVVAFTKECNFNCPTCYAKQVTISKEDYDPLEYLSEWTSGFVALGGEPTANSGLIGLLQKAKEKGLSVKLDTNGTNPAILKELIKNQLIDYVAMDIKGPRSLYQQLTNTDIDHTPKITESMNILKESKIDYELRTTVVPYLIEGKMKFLDENDIKDVCRWIKENSKEDVKYFLQKFVSRCKNEMMDERFSEEEIPEEFISTPEKYLKNLLNIAKEHLKNARIR